MSADPSVYQLTWTVLGEPVPQGSGRAVFNKRTGKSYVTHDNQRTIPWRQAVTGRLADTIAMNHPCATLPLWPRPVAVCVEVVFTFARPASRPKHIEWPATRPDLDKLCRAALDAMTGYLFDDDAQVTKLVAYKCYGAPRACFMAYVLGNRAMVKGGAA